MVLTTTGRKTGEPRQVPLSPVTVDGEQYLVAPYGPVAWVENARANREVTIRKGSKTLSANLVEVTGEVPRVLKEYWDREAIVHQYMDVPDAPTVDDFAARGDRFPVFRVEPA